MQHDVGAGAALFGRNFIEATENDVERRRVRVVPVPPPHFRRRCHSVDLVGKPRTVSEL